MSVILLVKRKREKQDERENNGLPSNKEKLRLLLILLARMQRKPNFSKSTDRKNGQDNYASWTHSITGDIYLLMCIIIIIMLFTIKRWDDLCPSLQTPICVENASLNWRRTQQLKEREYANKCLSVWLKESKDQSPFISFHHKHFLTLVGVKKIQQKEKIVIKFVKQLQLSNWISMFKWMLNIHWKYWCMYKKGKQST